MSKLKLLELFGGIGACSKALERLGIDYEIVDYVEIDKYAVKSFNAMHNTNFEPQDIITWDKDIEVDLIMHGSPCQDFSVSGKQAGGDEGSGTRSSLMYETIRIVDKLKPKYVIWENVKNIISKKHKHNYDNYCNKMSELGYINYGQVLNSKDYGIPQNRERVFTISIRSDLNQTFEFPQKQELKLKLKDMLEDKVDEKYYLSEKMINYILDNNDTQKGTKWEGRADNDTLNSNIAHTLSVRGAGGSQRAGVSNFIVDNENKEIKVKDLKAKINIVGKTKSGGQRSFILGTDGICNSLTATDYKQPKQILEKRKYLKIKNNTKKGYLEAYDGDGVYTNISTKRGTVQSQMIQTITTRQDLGVVVSNEK